MKKKDVRSMKLTMQLKSRSYDIILKAGCLANLHQFTNVANRKVFVLTDSGVPAEYAQTVAAQCPDSTVYTIPRGEGSKCLKVYGQVLQAMLAFGMDRKDLLVSVGGGVVGDLGGFCAASYMRGIDFVNCPTTVLSQVDSSIGGKTAIDLGETKNIVGAFWQPKVVLVDFDTLKTLPRRQVVNGLAEALKTGTVETAREAERGILDLQTLAQTNQSLIDSISEVMKIQDEGRAQRAEAEKQLAAMEGQLKEKLLELRR